MTEITCLNKKCAFNKKNKCSHKTIKLSEVGICLTFLKLPKPYKDDISHRECVNCVNEGCDNCTFLVMD